LLRLLPEARRLQRFDKVLDHSILERGVVTSACTNGIHLSGELDDTVSAWWRSPRPGGRVLINSGNIRNPCATASQLILDETVWVINDLAESIVRSDPRYSAYRSILDDPARMEAHAAFRNRVFMEQDRLDFYLNTLRGAGF
jgi:hypothetical protein